MADWTDKEILANQIASYYGYAFTEKTQAQAAWISAENEMYINNDYDAGQRDMLACLSEIIQCFNMLFVFNSQYSPKYGIAYFLKHHAGVDMEAILSAMWDSDMLRSFHFVNYIDAMRASIWNIEIYEEHLHEWYRHFSE